MASNPATDDLEVVEIVSLIEMIAKMRTSRSRDGSAWKCIDTEGVKVNKKTNAFRNQVRK